MTRTQRSNEQAAPLMIDLRIVAEMLGVSSATVNRMLVQGKLPRSVRLGRMHRFKRDEILQWIESGCPSRAAWESAKK